MKYLLILLTITCLSCQKKPYAFVQKSTQEQFVYKKNIVEQEILTTKMEALMDIEADASIAKPIGDFQQKEVVERPMPTFYKKQSIPTSIKKSGKVSIVLERMEQKFIPKKLLSNNATEENLKRSGKISGILGISSIVLLLAAFITTSMTGFASLLFVLVPFAALFALIFGIKPLRKLEKGNRTMAAIGVAIGSIILLAFLVIFGFIANAANQWS